MHLQVEYWQGVLKPLLHYTNDGPVVPKYYYVPAANIEAERRKPRSQKRLPSNDGSKDDLFLWGQAVLIISQLLGEAVVTLCVDRLKDIPERDLYKPLCKPLILLLFRFQSFEFNLKVPDCP